MVSSCRNNGTISQELRYPFTGTVVQFWQESSALQIIEMLPEENRSEQYGKLIDYILENVNKQ